MTSYKKGSDLKIKNIDQLDNIENRGIEIIHKSKMKIGHSFVNGYLVKVEMDVKKQSFANIKQIE